MKCKVIFICFMAVESTEYCKYRIIVPGVKLERRYENISRSNKLDSITPTSDFIGW